MTYYPSTKELGYLVTEAADTAADVNWVGASIPRSLPVLRKRNSDSLVPRV